jgi:hypothetical protein
MARRVAVPVGVGGFADVLRTDLPIRREPLGEGLVIGEVGSAIELGAIARREDGGLFDRRQRAQQILQRAGEPFGRKCDSLPQVDRCGAKVEAVGENGHLSGKQAKRAQ